MKTNFSGQKSQWTLLALIVLSTMSFGWTGLQAKAPKKQAIILKTTGIWSASTGLGSGIPTNPDIIVDFLISDPDFGYTVDYFAGSHELRFTLTGPGLSGFSDGTTIATIEVGSGSNTENYLVQTGGGAIVIIADEF